MQNISKEWIQENRYIYRSNVENKKFEEKYKSNYISDIAFNKKEVEKFQNEISINIPTMKPVSQGNAGRCWIIAGLNMLREHAVKKIKWSSLINEEFCFSPGYICFWDKIEKANCFLEKAIKYKNESYDKREVNSWFRYAITDGGFWTYFKDIVKKYGLVPAEIMPETFQSSNTEEMNNRLNYFLRKTGAEIRRVGLEGKKIEEIIEIKELAMKKIFTFLCRCYGCPPDSFVYPNIEDIEGSRKYYTPISFCDELIGDYLDNFLNVISLPYEKLPFGEMCVLRDVYQVVGGQEEVFLNLALVQLKNRCIEQLKDGLPIVCTADDDKMCREDLQLWDDSCFDYQEVTGFDFEMSRKDYFQLKAGLACHSMMITGVRLGEDGEPEYWKIENSYGIDGLHEGYFKCSDSWFDRYMVSVVLSRKYLISFEKEFDQKENSFNIWEIL